MTYFRPADERDLIVHQLAYNDASLPAGGQVIVPTQQDDIVGTEVQYDSTSNINFARFIVYEYTIQLWWNTDLSCSFLELWEQTNIADPLSWSYVGDKYRTTERFTWWQQSVVMGQFLIPVYSGSRKYKLRVRALDASNQAALHLATTGAGNPNKSFPPLIKMYTI